MLWERFKLLGALCTDVNDTMPKFKGTDERPTIDVGSFEVGDAFSAELGEWNGQGFKYHNYRHESDFLVIEVRDGEMDVVSYEDRIQWDTLLRSKNHDDLEITFHADGSVGGADPSNAIKEKIERYPGRGGSHMVNEGLIRTGRIDARDDTYVRADERA